MLVRRHVPALGTYLLMSLALQGARR